jgi:hypothetical protein
MIWAICRHAGMSGTRDEFRRKTYCESVSMLLQTTGFFRISYLMATIAVLAWLTPDAVGSGG